MAAEGRSVADSRSIGLRLGKIGKSARLQQPLEESTFTKFDSSVMIGAVPGR